MKRLSVIIPLYNSEKYIDSCLENLINQISDEDEIILINDGSIDNSEKKCLEYESKYKNIQYYQTNHKGPSGARNLGLNKVSGKYIIFLDIDDSIEKTYISKLLKHIENYDMVVCGYNLIKVEKNEKNIIKMKSQEIERKYIKKILNNELMFNTLWNKIYRADIIKNNKIQFDEGETRGEDAIFNMDYIKNVKNSIYVIDDILYNYFLRVQGINMGHYEKIIKKLAKIYKGYKKKSAISPKDTLGFLLNAIKCSAYAIYFGIRDNLRRKYEKSRNCNIS